MKKIFLMLIIFIGALSTLTAELVSSYHPPKEPAGLYIAEIEVGDSYSNVKRYRIYCPESMVRDISNTKWDKARKANDEERLKYGNGIFLDAFNQVCHRQKQQPGQEDLFSAQERGADRGIDESSVQKNFLIALSTKSYAEAKIFAKNLSIKTGIPLNLRGLRSNIKLGLSASQESCRNDEYSYPCYVARGRFDDGAYISVEYSSAYENFRGGYYIVMVASGDQSKSILRQTKSVVRDAYIKSSKVYMGCMH